MDAQQETTQSLSLLLFVILETDLRIAYYLLQITECEVSET